jgi:xylulokinase
MLSAASCFRWFCTLVGRDEARLLAEFSPNDSAVNAPIFLPYLADERTPVGRPGARACNSHSLRSTEFSSDKP